MTEGRKQILRFLEKNSKINLSELAILLGTDEVSLANEIAESTNSEVVQVIGNKITIFRKRKEKSRFEEL